MTKKLIQANLTWSLETQCPKCEQELDLSDTPHDDDGTYSQAIFNNSWGDLEGHDVWCPNCESYFELGNVEL